jgi:predicted O-methyltransferase YrrM
MAGEGWVEVDEFVGATITPDDEVLRHAVGRCEAAGLPPIQVSPPQGKLLNLLARSIRARTVLEFGTLGGYSSIWIGRALPDGGHLTSLEADPAYAEVARANIAEAGLDEVVQVRVGPALETLPLLESEGVGPFDLVFIDADKVNTPAYFAWSLEQTRPGGLIIADNVVRGGTLADGDSDDPTIVAQRRLHEWLATQDRISATTIQTVGVKGHDGFTLGLVAK